MSRMALAMADGSSVGTLGPASTHTAGHWLPKKENDSLLDQNATESNVLPPHLTFNDDSKVYVTVLSVLFVIASVGNLTVFITLFRNRHRRSRINLMIMHLAVADLIVTFFMIPLEIGWRLTVQWVAGDAACKAFLFFRAFGLYLSSMVLVCVSLDRYFAILHPLKVNDSQRRGKIMLLFAWTISILCSVPQSIVFHVQNHPEYPFFKQCVTFNSFPTSDHELAYNVFCMLAVYGFPLIIIVFVYTRILWEISKKSRETRDEMQREERFRGRMRLRRSDMSSIERARARTLRMTIIIVLAFIWCWTPYFVMTMWYMFDRESAKRVDDRLQESLFMFAVSNSCVNPLVYGTYAVNFRREFMRCLCRKRSLLRRKNTSSCLTRVSRGETTTLPTTTTTTNGVVFPHAHLPLPSATPTPQSTPSPVPARVKAAPLPPSKHVTSKLGAVVSFLNPRHPPTVKSSYETSDLGTLSMISEHSEHK